MQSSLSSIFLCFCLTGAMLTGCTERHQKEAIDDAVPKDFRSFYQQFLEDSSYQLEHIVFPLDGIRGKDNADTSMTFIPWQKDTWALHKRVADMDNYYHTFDILSDDLIVETIEERNAPIAMQRRYARMADGWHLIYYIEMQPMSRKQNE